MDVIDPCDTRVNNMVDRRPLPQGVNNKWFYETIGLRNQPQRLSI